MLTAHDVHAEPAAPPSRERGTVLRRLAGSALGYRLLQGLARCYGIEGVGVHSQFGLVTGPLDEAVVLQDCARHGFGARAANEFFCDFFGQAGGGTYIDVGAHLGLTTIPVAQNPHVTCRAFEPAPQSFKYLWHNVAENCPHANVAALNIALFDRPATLEMIVPQGNPGAARLRWHTAGDDDELPHQIVPVRAERLDDVLALEGLPRPVAARVAAQGAEARVFAGGSTVLGAADALVVEFAPALIREIDRDIGVVTDILARRFTTAALADAPDLEAGLLAWRPVSAIIDEMYAMMRGAPMPSLACHYVYAHR